MASIPCDLLPVGPSAAAGPISGIRPERNDSTVESDTNKIKPPVNKTADPVRVGRFLSVVAAGLRASSRARRRLDRAPTPTGARPGAVGRRGGGAFGSGGRVGGGGVRIGAGSGGAAAELHGRIELASAVAAPLSIGLFAGAEPDHEPALVALTARRHGWPGATSASRCRRRPPRSGRSACWCR